MSLYELALFSGAGGGLLATKWLLGFKTVCYVETESYRVEVLKARIRDGLLDDAPIWGDVRSFTKRNNNCRRFFRELRKIRHSLVVTAGFPCQPWSSAGKRLGSVDPRNLWPDTIRIIREIRPQWCLLENTPNLLSGSHGYFGQILQDLAESGYNARWKVLSAAELGAPHKRDRIWVVAANTDCNELRLESGRGCWQGGGNSAELGDDGADGSMADSQGEREAATEQSRRWHGFVTGGQDMADPDGPRELQPQRCKQEQRRRAGNGGLEMAYPNGE